MSALVVPTVSFLLLAKACDRESVMPKRECTSRVLPSKWQQTKQTVRQMSTTLFCNLMHQYASCIMHHTHCAGTIRSFAAAQPVELAVYFLGPQPRGLRFLIHLRDLGIRLYWARWAGNQQSPKKFPTTWTCALKLCL